MIIGLGQSLRRLRKAKGISLRVAAEAIGVSKPHLWELEKGKTDNPTIKLLKNLARYYEVNVYELMGECAPPEAWSCWQNEPDGPGIYLFIHDLGERVTACQVLHDGSVLTLGDSEPWEVAGMPGQWLLTYREPEG